MDYVVAGFGIGAILALIGFALWELFGESDEPGQSWLSRTAIGLMLGSLVIWAITGVSLVSTIDDSTGSHLVLLTTLITLAAIAAGAFWYWRADQALLASIPPQKRATKPNVQTEVKTTAVNVAAPATDGSFELSEWDSWPEREQPAASSDTSGVAPAAAVSFEPEVAVATAAVAEIDVETIDPLSSVSETVDAPVEDHFPDSEVPHTAVEIVAESGEQPNAEDVDTDDAGEVDSVEPAPSHEPLKSELESSEFPPNVRPIRPPAVVEPEHIDTAIKVVVAESPDSEPIVIVDEMVIEPVEPLADGPVAPVAPVAFESSILADIDVTQVDGETRYRSPLLADLESDPNELEGVGLAKWRPEARLTAETDDDPPAPKSRRRH